MRLRLARREFVPLKVRAMHLMLFCFLTETPEVPTAEGKSNLPQREKVQVQVRERARVFRGRLFFQFWAFNW